MDDELRDPTFLKSLLYSMAQEQVEHAVRFLSQQEKASLFREVMKTKLESVK
jgi:hypothetical protein